MPQNNGATRRDQRRTLANLRDRAEQVDCPDCARRHRTDRPCHTKES